MNKVKMTVLVFLLIFTAGLAAQEDPYLWLEKVQSPKALDWVKKQNASSTAVLEKVEGFKSVYESTLKLLNSRDRIPYAGKMGKFFYNYWRDAKNPRGIYRRTTLEEYKKKNPKWEIVFDLDAYAKKTGKNYVWKGMSVRYPAYDRGLMQLSIGGADAVVVKEFDIESKSFVKGGFELPNAKSRVSWKDKNSIYVGTNFGPGSLTKSGYPRIAKLWKRGTALKDAKTIYEAKATSISTGAGRMYSGKDYVDYVADAVTFFDSDFYIQDSSKGNVKINLPKSADITGYFKKQLIIKLKKPFKQGSEVYPPGSVLIESLAKIRAGKAQYKLIAKPTKNSSIASVSTTKDTLLVNMMEDVVSRLYQYRMDKSGKWARKEVKVGLNGTVSVFNTSDNNNDYFVNYNGFLTPGTLYMVDGTSGKVSALKSAPAKFNAKPFIVDQFLVKSKDGTNIPYFVIRRKDMKKDGHNPTLLYGYGGFMVSMRPFYSAGKGINWLEKGGVFVLANIRGGGEYGPRWHQVALKKNRMKCYEDFIAVAEDLIRRKITKPAKLGIQGGSNGGLLVGATFVLRPDLFNAVVCQVPLLDMKRYTKLLAGASWADEYGDPDKPDMWNYIKTYSPYQNVKKGVKYPEVLFTTSTKDDRVHPAHARKMVARMKEQGHKIYYYENTEGGHAGAANNKQRAYMAALEYAYLYKKLMGK